MPSHGIWASKLNLKALNTCKSTNGYNYFFFLSPESTFGGFQISSGVADILPPPIEGGDLLGFAFPPPASEDSMFCKVSFIDNRVDTTPTNKIY